jgi:menaquinone-dependent protoporphyrinogen oxidase
MPTTVAVFYATREGHARLVSDHIASQLRRRGLSVDVENVAALDRAVDWSRWTAAVVAASVHVGRRHEREMIAFVKRQRRDLERLDAAFISVSLAEAGAEDATAPPERRHEAAADAWRMIDRFISQTGWQPAHVLAVAGALAYTHYNVFIRFVMRRIARAAGAPTDTSRDYEFTDWATLDRFVSDAVDAALLRAGGVAALRPAAG